MTLVSLILRRQTHVGSRLGFRTMFSLKRKPKPVASTPFSEFIRNASSAEKKRVYKRVLKKASERQNRILARAGKAKPKSMLKYLRRAPKVPPMKGDGR